jgi:hypothetical protein
MFIFGIDRLRLFAFIFFGWKLNAVFRQAKVLILIFQTSRVIGFLRLSSYYIAEIWGADASPNFWGFFIVDGPYTMVNFLMMQASSYSGVFKTYDFHTDFVCAMHLLSPAQNFVRTMIRLTTHYQFYYKYIYDTFFKL